MDQHPIPQDVTGFQFKLIGTMTVKQFGYVAVGVIAAVILYYLPLHGSFAFLFKLVFIPLFGIGGVVIAFVPIEGRPVDVMTNNFFKALFSPNQYVYRRKGHPLRFSELDMAPVVAQTGPTQISMPEKKQQRMETLMFGHQPRAKNKLDEKEAQLLSALSSAALNTTTQIAGPQMTTASSLPQSTQALQKQEGLLEQQLETAKKEEEQTHVPSAYHKVLELEQQIKQIHLQKQQLEAEILHLKGQIPTPTVATTNPVAQTVPHQVPQAPQVVTQTPGKMVAPIPAVILPSPVATQTPQPASFLKTLPQGVGLLRVSDTPNVVVGIVRDPRGNVLPNILVEIKDKNNNPVRAFKTNALGQFASATALPVDTYTIELEDPKKLNTFDKIQLITNDQILMPIEIISHDAREELRKQLFS